MLDADWTLCLACKQHQISPTRRGQLTTQRIVHVCAFLVEGPVISAGKVLSSQESRMARMITTKRWVWPSVPARAHSPQAA
jgi:hypothetical protein